MKYKKTCIVCLREYPVRSKSRWETSKTCSVSCKNKYARSFTRADGSKFREKLDSLGITKEELDDYISKHPVCEICGGTEKVRALALDHNHSTGKFRGLLCMSCNTKLGWLENNKDAISKYLPGLFV